MVILYASNTTVLIISSEVPQSFSMMLIVLCTVRVRHNPGCGTILGAVQSWVIYGISLLDFVLDIW